MSGEPLPVGVSSADRARFRAGYSAFVGERDRILLTGHSHQAWPDAARAAMNRYFDESAEHVDDKWGACVFPLIDRVGARILERLGFAASDAIAFGRSTHELVSRLLSCLPLRATASRGGTNPRRGRTGDGSRPRIVTTTAEFHSLRRQLDRLEEAGARVARVPASPREELVDRILDTIVPGTDLVAVSAVLYEDAYILPRLGEIVSRTVEVGAVPLVDAYHAFNIAPFDLGPDAGRAYVVAGGYKYAQFGEGLCFMRIPSDCDLRPVDTGWFADFASLELPVGAPREVQYGAGGARFAGATFDPAAIYRADAVLGHFGACGMTVAALRAISVEQTAMLVELLLRSGADIVSPRDPARRAGFVTMRTPAAHDVVRALREQGVFLDARADRLRAGPAPYLTNNEIERGAKAIAQALLVGTGSPAR